MGDIGAVILAAGESKRLGRSKQLLQFRGKSLIRRVVEAAIAAKCRPVVVVLGTDQRANETIPDQLRDTKAKIVFNSEWRRGIGTSIRAGVKEVAADDEVSGALLLTCDQPFVDAPLLEHLVAAHQRTKKPVVASAYDGTLGVPALFERSCFDELLQLGDDEGAKKLILQDPSRMKLVLFRGGEVDIDTPADYQKLGQLDRAGPPQP
jgi:molybdenum cofactor cytidylyltransferase